MTRWRFIQETSELETQWYAQCRHVHVRAWHSHVSHRLCHKSQLYFTKEITRKKQ